MIGLKHISTTSALPVRGARHTQASLNRSQQISQSFNCRHATPRRQQKLQRLARAASSSTETDSSVRGPEDARGAISIGLGLYEEGKYNEALDVFEKGLELPGTGMKRYRDKPRSISDGEKQSLLFNIACCHSQLQDARTGLVALAGCLEAGYDDAKQLLTDPDLEFLRKDSRFKGLIQRFKIEGDKGFLGSFLKGFNL